MNASFSQRNLKYEKYAVEKKNNSTVSVGYSVVVFIFKVQENNIIFYMNIEHYTTCIYRIAHA